VDAEQKLRQSLAALAEGLRDDIARRIERASGEVLSEALLLANEQSRADVDLFEAVLTTTSKLTAASSLTEVLDVVGREVARLRPGSTLLVMRDGALAPWSADSTTADVDAGERLPLTVGGHVVAELRMDPDPQRSRAMALELVARFAAQRLEVITARRSAELMASKAVAGAHATSEGDPSDDPEAAKRYARLLVSEIRLYHETAILEGRKSGDLGSRLAGEIARARSLYNQRVGESRHLAQYFRDELVKTLADGDATII
jgi:hypothetical protein